MAIKKDITFMRVGGINSIKQKGFKPENADNFHSPPASRGIYAFVQGLYVGFLLGGSNSKMGQQHSKFEYLKDKEGNKIEVPMSPRDKYLEENNIDWLEFQGAFPEEVLREERLYQEKWEDYLLNHWTHMDDDGRTWVIKPKKIRTFNHYGDIWHHLVDKVKSKDVIDRRGKYWIKTSYEVFCKAFAKEYAQIKQPWVKTSDQKMGNKDFWIGPYGKDHMEVFIEKVQESKK